MTLTSLGISPEQATEFELGELEKPDAKSVAKKIMEKAERYAHFIESFLTADGSSLAALTEIKAQDTRKLNELFSLLMAISREYLIADLANTEKEFRAFIVTALKQWESAKPGLLEIVRKAKAAWTDVVAAPERLGYLG